MTTVGLAGRRIDADDADEKRFPLANRERVCARVRAYLADLAPQRLVCSAACGADLLALSAALQLGVSSVIVVMPFEPDVFRETSVTDRPGGWGLLYDQVLRKVEHTGEVITLGLALEDPRRYRAATERIVEEAAGGPPPARICLVWDGVARGDGDETVALAKAGRARGWSIDEISTS